MPKAPGQGQRQAGHGVRAQRRGRSLQARLQRGPARGEEGDHRGVWQRANAYFTQCGLTVKHVLTTTDRLTGQRCSRRARRCGAQADPAVPLQTNSKVERYNRTLEQEWPTPAPTAARPSASPPCPSSCTPTITTAATPRSKATHPRAVSVGENIQVASTLSQASQPDTRAVTTGNADVGVPGSGGL